MLDEGSYLEATIDHAGDTPMGPRPDLRRMLVPIGPVAVFGASNFPLAFSVPGGDTASALAAGLPGHRQGARLAPGDVATGLRGHGRGRRDGRAHRTARSASCTASRPAPTWSPTRRSARSASPGRSNGGRALLQIIERRPDPIPFYGELSSLNPVVVTPSAAAERGDAIGRELVGSFTLGAGQFCTKPGLTFVPAGADGDRVVDAMAEAIRGDQRPGAAQPGHRRRPTPHLRRHWPPRPGCRR